MKKHLGIIIPLILVVAMLVLAFFAFNKQEIKADEPVAGGELDVKPVVEPVVQLKVDGVELSKQDYDDLKTELKNKISGSEINHATVRDIRQIQDLVNVQSQKCENMQIDGKFDWSAVRKILELNC